MHELQFVEFIEHVLQRTEHSEQCTFVKVTYVPSGHEAAQVLLGR